MKEVVLVKLGEIALKGLNRRTFEDVLKKNIKKALYGLGWFKLSIAQSTITVTPESKDVDMDKVEDAISRVFGIVSYTRACVCEKDMDDIYAKAPEYLEDILNEAKTETKRRATYLSNEICGLLHTLQKNIILLPQVQKTMISFR